MKKGIFAYIAEGIIKICGYSTALIILLIVLFLFSEGFTIFGHEPLEEGYSLYVHKSNQVQSLSDVQVKDIYDQKIDNWKELGGSDASIAALTVNEIVELYPEDLIGEDFEGVGGCASAFADSIPGALIFLADQYVSETTSLRAIELEKIGLGSFFAGKQWFPTSEPVPVFGILPLIAGTLLVSFFAILLALPIGIAVAVYLAEIADKRMRNILKPVMELLSGIPSVVYGFFGLVVIVPLIQKAFDLPVGETGLAGSIILAIMALPTIITVSEDAIRTVPIQMKEASLALGASHWQTIRKVILPYAASGISAAAILGIGRAIGETMAVLMVTGNAAVIPTGIAQPLRTIPATIAAELGEAPYGGLHFQALFALACILFIITMGINLIVNKYSKKRMAI